MSKFKILIGICCVTTLGLFGTMLYLMSGVNPPPIKTDDELMIKDDLKESHELKFENVIFDDVPGSSQEPIQYGLEKVGTDSLEYSTYIPFPTYVTEHFNNLWRYTPRRVQPPVWPATTTSASVNMTRTVIVPTGLDFFNQTDIDNETTTPSTNDTASIIPVKRSVKDVRKLSNEENPSSIYLKITDDKGQVKIEIKLGSNGSIRRKSIRGNRNSVKSKTKIGIPVKGKSNQFHRHKQAKNTIINIVPNDYATIYEYDDNREEKKVYNILNPVNKEENETENIGANVLNINDTEGNSSDYENILFLKQRHIMNASTELPVDKDIFTVKGLFNITTKKDFESKNNINLPKRVMFDDEEEQTSVSNEVVSDTSHNTAPNETSKVFTENSTVPSESVRTENSTTPLDISTNTENVTFVIQNSTAQYGTPARDEINRMKALEKIVIPNDDAIQIENFSVQSKKSRLFENKNASIEFEKALDFLNNNISYFS